MGKSYASVAAKMRRLNITREDNNRDPAGSQLLSTLKLPEDLPSVEEQLRVLVVLYIGCAVFEEKKRCAFCRVRVWVD